eukprot:CAMPEP_0116565992 /NCGR_PEP_ID=MMETSP0397-20121206/14199_1 /TAXON_ID=216820 /ORGANISM="Cyclophora tenuis, Strain ECT3854" /LENGTH=167 /DNA_ID=CAMNT_0004092813 /DNA_START=115 /DNA_END=618 /DNA_ORIENTATION=-
MSLADIQQRLKHTHVELIKMDIEGYEIPLMHSWWRYGEGQGDDDDDNNNNDIMHIANKDSKHIARKPMSYPVQLLMELHYCTYSTFAKSIQNEYMKTNLPASDQSCPASGGDVIQTATDLVTLQSMLLDMGYIVVSRDDNSFCPHCTELVLVRIPPSQLFPKKQYHD